MPKGFMQCAKHGGRVRTIRVNKTKCVRICYDKKNKSHAGETFKCKPKRGVGKKRR
jgi:hypothetical protein